MTQLIQHFISFFLALVLALSPLQLTMASDFDQNSHGLNCQMNSTQSNETVALGDDCVMEHNDHCFDHPGCVAQFSPSSLLVSNSFLSVARAATQLKFQTDGESLLTHYPALIIRPPKA